MMRIFCEKALKAFSRQLSLQKSFIVDIFQAPKYSIVPCVSVKAMTFCQILRQVLEEAPCIWFQQNLLSWD